jgi:hypothetical protein
MNDRTFVVVMARFCYLRNCVFPEMRQIERFYARNLPLSREMAINLQSFGSG